MLKLWGPWSPIHLLSIFSLTMLPLGIYYARRHIVRGHKLTMLGLFAGVCNGEVILLYVDEAHCHRDLDLGYTWGRRGQRLWRTSVRKKSIVLTPSHQPSCHRKHSPSLKS